MIPRDATGEDVGLDDEQCPGLFGPCYAPVTHYLEDPDDPTARVPLCTEHWNWTMDLEKHLRANPDIAARFAFEIDKAKAGGEQ